MEYYATVPSRATRKGVNNTRSRCKNRTFEDDDDDYSFAPITHHMEIRRSESTSPSRTKGLLVRSETKQRSKPLWLLTMVSFCALVLTSGPWNMVARRSLRSTTQIDGIHHKEILREIRQHLAQLALENLKKSERNIDIENGSSGQQWRSCTCQKALERKGAGRHEDEPLKMVVLGPSSTDEECPHYSTLLEKQLTSALQDGETKRPFEIVYQSMNNPSLQGLLLDQRVDVHNTDILVWEQSRRKEQDDDSTPLDRETELFLSRVAAHFGQAGLPPPPILVLQLEEEELPNQPQHTFPDWNIQMIHVGKMLSSTPSQEASRSLVGDEKDHANCRKMEVISAMVQRIIYQDLATCHQTFEDNFGDTSGSSSTGGIERRSEGTVTTTKANTTALSRNTTVPLVEIL